MANASPWCSLQDLFSLVTTFDNSDPLRILHFKFVSGEDASGIEPSSCDFLTAVNDNFGSGYCDTLEKFIDG